MGREKRQYPRLSVPLEAQILVAGSEEWQAVILHDLSAGGLSFGVAGASETIEGLERVRFRLPSAERDLDLRAEVVWCREIDGGNFAGLRFTEPDSESIDAIHQYVFEQLIAQSADLLGTADEPAARIACSEPIRVRYDRFTRFVDEVTENLSPTGMFIRCQQPHSPGSTFEFKFQLNDDLALIQGEAAVIWTREVTNDRDLPCGMGVRFLELTDESREMIEKIVRQKAERESASPEEPGRDSDLHPAEADSRPDPKELTAQLDRIRAKAKKREQEYRIQVENAAQVLAALRARVSELEEESEGLRSAIDTERTSHQEQIEAVASNRDQLVKNFEHLQSEHDQLAAELEAERRRVEATDEQHGQAAGALEQVESELAAERARREAIEAELEDLRARLAEAEEAAEKAAAETAGATVERATPAAPSDGEAAALSEKIAELEASLSTSETARKQMGRASREAHDKERAARKALREAVEQRDKLRAKLAEVSARLDRAGPGGVADTPADARERLTALERERDLLDKKLRVATDSEEAAGARLRKLSAEHDATLEELAKVRRSVEALERRLDDADTEASRIRDEYEAKIAAVHAEYDKAGELASEGGDPEQLARSLAAARRQIEQARAEAEDRGREAETELQELKASLSASEAARRQIAKQAAEASAHEEALREQMQQLKLRERAAGDEATRFKSSLRDLGSRLSARDIEVEAIQSERDALEAELEAQRAHFETARRQSRKRPLRAAALVAAGTFAGILAGSFLPGDPDRTALPHPAEAVPPAVAHTVETPGADPEAEEPAAGPHPATAVLAAAPAIDPGAEPAVEPPTVTGIEPPAEQAAVTPAVATSPAVAEAVRTWAGAWAGQDVDAYLDAYDRDFSPPKGLTREAWVAQRRERIERPEWIRVGVEAIETTNVSADRARAVFTQIYETPTYSDQVTKTLELALRDDGWKILEETSS